MKMKKEDFFNMLYNILDVWAVLLDKSYYAVFAWSLLEYCRHLRVSAEAQGSQ